MKSSKFSFIALLLLVIFIILYIINVSLNFIVLGFIAILCISFICRIDIYTNEINDNRKLIKLTRPIINVGIGKLASFVIIIFTGFTLATLHNYFYSDKIFKNNEHHALKVDGVRIKNPIDFVLVKNDSTALFDDESFHGSLVIDSYTQDTISLRYKNFTHPIFQINKINDVDDIYNFPESSRKDRSDNQVYVIQNNQDDIIDFGANDSIIFINRNGKELGFKLVEFDLEKSLNPLNHDPDSANYHFKMKGEEEQICRFTSLLVQGYSLNNILNGVNINTNDFDLTGINIVRQVADRRARNKEKSLGGETRYAFEICNDAFSNKSNRIDKIKIGDKTYVINDKTQFCDTITIPMGKKIFIGYGDHQTRIFSFNCDSLNRLEIKFQESIYRNINAIEGRRENTLYVTNSIIRDMENGQNTSENIGINIPNNVLSFDFFNYNDNKNMFRPFYLSFSSGKTTENMTFIWNYGTKCDTINNASQDKYVYINADDNLSWIFTTENLREKTKFDSRKMMMTVLVVGLIASIMINFSLVFGGYNKYKYNRCTYSCIEFIAYIVIIYFVAFRCFLLWRISVFRPLENVTEFELNNIFNNTEYYKWLVISLGFFFLAIAVIKGFILWHKNKAIDLSNKNQELVDVINKDSIYEFLTRPIYSIVQRFRIDKLFSNTFFDKNILSWKKVIIFLYILYPLLIIVGSANSRFALLLIIILYFVIDIVINSKCGHQVFLDEGAGNKYTAFSSLIYTFLNMICAIVSMIIDAGFMVMFITFCIISFCMKVLDLYTKISENNSDKHSTRNLIWLYLGFFTAILLLLMIFKRIIISVFMSRFAILTISLLLFLFFYTICKIIKIPIGIKNVDSEYKNIFRILYGIIVAGLIAGIFTALFGINLQTIFENKSKSTIQRINVQLYEPHKAIMTLESNEDEVKFLQASHNHWIIEQYNKRSENVKPWGEKGNGFFKLHPQSKLGAMWNAQISDIILLRYVITEHGKMLPLIFISLFIIMLYYGIRTTTYFRYTKSLLIQIPLLIFIQALLVWLANTQRFIFFGQDFPFIAISAKIMLVYIFVLMTMWVGIATIESIMHRRHPKSNYERLNDFNIDNSRYIIWSLFIVAFIYFIIIKIQYRKNENKDSRYQMEILFKESKPYINAIDNLFALYQHEEHLEIKNNMHSEIVDFNQRYGSKITEELKRIDSIEIENGNTDSEKHLYIQRIWNNYVEKDSYNNSYTNLLHVHKPDSILHIAMRKDYYDLILPHKYNESWEGNIIEIRHPINPIPTINNSDSYTYYQIPKDWVKDGQSYHMLKKNGNKKVEVFSLSTNQILALDNNGIRQVVALYDNDDHVFVDKKNINLPIEKKSYWARNIHVNGRRSFIYPAGKELYWVRDFANVVKQVEENTSDELNNIDVAITLDRKLTTELYDELRNSTRNIVRDNTADTLAQRSVIVVDGNGHIKAMVDYKYGYELNPNDYRTISKLSEEIYMNAEGNKISKESNYFENRNLAYLRGGPGSSQKPLVWTAVASAIEFDWKNLTLVGIRPEFVEIESNSKFIIRKFNGERVAGFRSLGSDECANAKTLAKSSPQDINLIRYLAYSSNYYSALMVYLGLHSSDLYNDKDFINTIGKTNDTVNHVFRQYKNPTNLSKDEYLRNYPFMKIGNKYVVLGRDIMRDKADTPYYVNHLNNSVLYKQMTNVFGLNDAYNAGRSEGILYTGYITDSIFVKNSRGRSAGQIKIYTESTMPATSSINFDKFEYTKENEKDGWGFQHTNNIVRSIAIGDNSAWNVTPMKMAEMYGRMFTMNTAFNCTFNPDEKFIATNDTRIDTHKKFEAARSDMYQSMNIFFTKGTGKNIRSKLDKNKDRLKKKGLPIMYTESECYIEYNGKTYYLYGKTGTSNNRKLNKEYRRLAIIISDTKMHEENVMPNKFYILYFTYDYKYFDLGTTSYNILEEVIKSESFQNYMNN